MTELNSVPARPPRRPPRRPPGRSSVSRRPGRRRWRWCWWSARRTARTPCWRGPPPSVKGGPTELYSGSWSILYAVWEIYFYLFILWYLSNGICRTMGRQPSRGRIISIPTYWNPKRWKVVPSYWHVRKCLQLSYNLSIKPNTFELQNISSCCDARWHTGTALIRMSFSFAMRDCDAVPPFALLKN